MGISIEYINNLLKDYDASGQKKHGGSWRKSNAGFSTSVRRVALTRISPYLDDAHLNAPGSYYSYVEQLKTYIYMYIHRYIKSFPMTALSNSDLMVSQTEYGGHRHHTDRYVDIFIDPDALWRDSLWNTAPAGRAEKARNGQAYWSAERHKYGVDNIVTLFEYGWHARGRVQGKWHDAPCWNRVQMAGTYMLHTAIDLFNHMTPRGITATLGTTYKG